MAFGWSRKVFQDHSTKRKHVQKQIGCCPRWSPHIFQHHPVGFVKIYIPWNGFGKPIETIQNLMLMHKN